jgi:large subunit ribosomal protein L23
MKLVKLEHMDARPSNQVTFLVSQEMTKFDVKNYLEKIYKVPVESVKTRNIMGKVYRNMYLQGELTKAADNKIAFVTLEHGQTFEFPDLKLEKKEEDFEKNKDEIGKAKTSFQKSVNSDDQKYRTGVPSFFGL